MNFRFVVFQIQQFQVAPSIESEDPNQTSSEKSEALLFWLRGTLAANGGRHLPDEARDGRISKRQRSCGVLHLAHGRIVVGDLPVGRPGERLGDGARRKRPGSVGVVAVDHDFELGAADGKELS